MSYSAPPILTFAMPMVPAAGVMGIPTRSVFAVAPGNGTSWITSNSARYIPTRIPAGVLVQRLWVPVGATGGTDTWDLGIYTSGGTRIVSKGSTTAGTANTVQFMDITDTYLAPGDYYIAMSSSGTTAKVF